MEAERQELTERIGRHRVGRGVPLAPYTTFRIGGPAALYVEAATTRELVLALSAARELGIPHFLLGMGANILIGDGGFDGLVVRNTTRRVAVDPALGLLTAESGAVMYPDVIGTAVAAGLSGIEHYVGIPSTVGGALWQNLHFLSPPPERTRTMFIAEVLQGASILGEDGDLRSVDAAYFAFGYDYSVLHDRDDVVLSATFRLEPGDPSALRRTMAANLEWRRERHPPLDTEPSAGSVFKKIDGVGAGRLIDGCGLKGHRVGGAEVSPRHANIFVNRGGATASDVRSLIEYVQGVVERETGYRLEPEIAFVGTF